MLRLATFGFDSHRSGGRFACSVSPCKPRRGTLLAFLALRQKGDERLGALAISRSDGPCRYASGLPGAPRAAEPARPHPWRKDPESET